MGKVKQSSQFASQVASNSVPEASFSTSAEAETANEEVTFESRNESAHKQRKKAISMAKRSGTVFPPTRIRKNMKKAHLAPHIGTGAGVYCAAVIEYLVAEVLELSGQAAKDNKYKTIKPRHIVLAIRNDEELDKIFKGITISQGGVLPHINPILLPKRTASRNVNVDEEQKEDVKSKKKGASKSKKQTAVAEPMDSE